jgi:hypothetical protein
MSWSDYRIGLDRFGYAFIEKRDGHDTLGVTRWRQVSQEQLAASASGIFSCFAKALEARRKRARREREARRTGR